MKRIREEMEDIMLLFFLVGMALAMIFQVISRYLFKDTPAFTEELVRYLFIWSVFLSIPFSIKHKLDVRIRLFPLSKTMDKGIHYLLVFVFLGLFLATIPNLRYARWSHETSPALGLPMFYVHLAPAIGFALAALRSFERTRSSE